MTMRRDGFTLMEVLVSMLVGTTLAALLYAVLGQLRDAESRIAGDQFAAARAANAHEGIMRLLESATLDAGGSPQPWAGTRFDGGPDTLSFPIQPGPESPAAFADHIRIFVDPAEGLVLEQHGRTGRRADVLLTRVRSMRVRYAITGPGEPYWTERWQSSLELPLAIEIMLRTDPPDGMLQLPILALLGEAGR